MRTEDGYIIHKCLNGDPAAFGLLVDKYKGSIYALAYSKLGNFHDAEDVTQEVFIKAFQKLRALRRWDSFYAWLYAITANLCKQWTRSQSKRPDRAVASDQEPGVLRRISADSSVNSHREELVYASVSEALESLPEKYRQILALHYLGGMTYSEMSRFLGVSISTITKRLKTARDRLEAEMMPTMTEMYTQQKLDADFTLHTMGILQGMKPVPVPRAQWLPWGISLTAGLIIAVLGLNSNFILLDRSSAGYEFTILNEVRAELLPRDLHTSETPTSRRRRNGEALIYIDVPVTLMATSEKMAGASSMNLQQGLADQAENRPLTAAISHSEERTIISGKVMRGDVHVPNAHVYIYGQNAGMKWETTTQADGSFEMEIPKPDDAVWERLTAVAQHPGYSLGWTKLSRNNAANATIRLRQPVTISGMIQDRQGNPIQGVDVRVSRVAASGPGVPGGDRLSGNNIPISAVKTDVDGTFFYGNLPEGSGVALHISKTGYAQQNKYNIAAGTEGLLLELAPEGRIEGRVTYDRTRKPAEGVDVRAEGIEPISGHVYSRTDAEGRYSIADLSAGEYNMRITKYPSSEWAATGSANVEVFEGQVTGNIDLKLVKAGFVTGRVTDKNTDEPIRKCQVRIRSPQAPASLTYTDEDGLYKSRVVPGKTYISPIAPEGYTRADPAGIYVDVVEGETVSDTHFLLQKVAQLSVTGRTVSADGVPVAGAAIIDRLQRHKVYAISDSDGAFTISGLQPGQRLVVEARHGKLRLRGYADAEIQPGLEIKILMGERYESISVSGRVVDEQGIGVPAANIALVRFDRYLARNIQSELQVYAGMTDGSGTYRIPEMIVGDEYMIHASADGYIGAEMYAFTATEDMSQLRNTMLLRSGDFFLQGRVINSDGTPLVGARVFTRSVSRKTETNENGYYRLHKLPFSVEMQVDVIHPDYGHHVFRYVPTSRTQDFVIIRGEKYLAGKVVDANGDPVAGVSVSAQHYVDETSAHISMVTLTSHQGEFQLDGLLYERESIHISSHELDRSRVFENVETNREDAVFVLEEPTKLPEKTPLAEEVSETKDGERAERSLKELMGKPAPELDVAQWVYGEPVTLAELRGKVVVLHFWTSTDFPSVEAIRLLDALQEEYSQRGLVCIGIHEFTTQANRLRKLIAEKEVAYRIAVDGQWPSTTGANGITLAKYASVGSFILIDRMGMVYDSVWDRRLETTIWKLLSD